MTTKAVAVPTTNLPSTFSGGGTIDTKDLVLPRVVLRQNTYEKEYMADFNAGDIILRPDNIVLGTKGKPAHFVPIGVSKVWSIVEMTSGKAKTIGSEPFTQEKKELQWEVDGRTFRRDVTYNVHMLFLRDLEAQVKMFERLSKGEYVDPDDLVLPAQITLSRSARNAGKTLVTHFEKCRVLNNQSPAGKMFQLMSVPMKNDKGNWWAFEIEKVTDPKTKYTPANLVPVANFWVEQVARNKYKSVEETETVAEEIAVEGNGQASEASTEAIPF